MLTVGSVLKSVGKSVSGRLLSAGTVLMGDVPVDPGIMLAHIGARDTLDGSDGGQVFCIADERLSGLGQCTGQIGNRQRGRTGVLLTPSMVPAKSARYSSVGWDGSRRRSWSTAPFAASALK